MAIDLLLAEVFQFRVCPELDIFDHVLQTAQLSVEVHLHLCLGGIGLLRLDVSIVGYAFHAVHIDEEFFHVALQRLNPLVAKVASEATLLPVESHVGPDLGKFVVNVFKDLRFGLVEAQGELKLVESVADPLVGRLDLSHIFPVGFKLSDNWFNEFADCPSGSRLHSEQIELARCLELAVDGCLAPREVELGLLLVNRSRHSTLLR